MVGIERIINIKTKETFKRVLPVGYSRMNIVTNNQKTESPTGSLAWMTCSQADFLREYYPSGHKINSPEYYPDIEHKDPDGKVFYEMVDRCAFAFQQVITCKQLVHLCGNSIQFELDEQVKDKKAEQVFKAFRSGWLEKNMEVAWYEFAKSVKSTGDAAFVGFRHKGKFGWKILSYATGSTLFPHYHPITGELDLFARAFTVDENGETINYMEAWDHRNMYLFREDSKAGSTTISTSEQIYSIDGYALQSVTTHSFPFIPVTYFRDENGPCWSPSQDSIEQYELAFSRMSQNNAAYAFPIMYFKGNNVEIQGSITRGTVTSVTMGKDDEAGFLNRQDVSSAFITQLDKLYKVIYEQSFAVIPPDLKSGDLPGVAVKLLYSPAYEKALTDAQEYQRSIEQMQTIFKEGYGTEIGMQREMTALRLNSWIKPYIHQNWTETITNMAMAVQNGFLSRKRANEVADEYATPQDWEQILSETKEEQQHDLLLQTQKQVNDVQTQE